jgi:hypothetical protein
MSAPERQGRWRKGPRKDAFLLELKTFLLFDCSFVTELLPATGAFHGRVIICETRSYQASPRSIM